MKLKSIPFTQQGYENLLLEQQALQIKRKTVVINLQKAREMGDLSENGFYKAAKMELRTIDSRLIRLTQLLRQSSIIPVSSTTNVTLGSTVTVTCFQGEYTYMIVGEYEANPTDGKISHRSPLGQALLQRKIGESITITIPSGTMQYTIKAIS